MGPLLSSAKKPDLPPVQKVAPPPEVTEDVGDEEAKRIRRRGQGGFLGTLKTGPLASSTGKKRFLG